MNIISARQLAELLNVSHVLVCRMAQHGKIPATRIGRAWLFTEEHVEHILATYTPRNAK